MMTGYYIVIGPCSSCRQSFVFNPLRVPSNVTLTGKREPICQACMEAINGKRKAAGLEPIAFNPQAYDAVPEEEF